MRIDILTVFPEMVAAALDHSIVRRARERGLVAIQVVNLRDFTRDRHKTTDDMPYGGGGGMVMKIEPIARALDFLTGQAPCSDGETPHCGDARETESGGRVVKESDAAPRRSAEETAHSVLPGKQDPVPVSEPGQPPARPRIVLMDPRGPRFTQEIARRWAQEAHLILLCGHYEGVDERVRQYLVTDEISIGDYILTGGELPALVITDALTRLQPGALGDEEAPDKDTFSDNLLEYPHYTRPRAFRGWAVPDMLLSGHHARIERWRRWHQLHATRERRPDLLAQSALSPEDAKLLDSGEPQAPPEKPKPGRARDSSPLDAAAQPLETTERDEETDGAGTGNHT